MGKNVDFPFVESGVDIASFAVFAKSRRIEPSLDDCIQSEICNDFALLDLLSLKLF